MSTEPAGLGLGGFTGAAETWTLCTCTLDLLQRVSKLYKYRDGD